MRDCKPLKICFVMFGAYPLFNPSVNKTFGGAEVELYNLATYMAGLDHIQVDFIVGDYGQSDIENYQNIKLIKVKYMNLNEYRSLIYKILRYFHLFRTLLMQPSQIYITKTASELLGWLVLFEKIIKRKKVIFRLGSDKDADIGFWKNSRKEYYLYQLGLKHCNLIYTQSKDQERMLRERYGIGSCVVKNVFHINNEEIHGIKQYILWVSRCEPLKRPLFFIEMAKNLPNEKFVMIMPHVNKRESLQHESIQRITREVEKAACELSNLEYLEYVPFDQIQNYYNQAKLFVNTSEYEGFPNSFIQACMGGTGILSLQVNPDRFLTEYDLGHCCQDNMGEAIDFIRELNDDQIEKMGRHAVEYVMQNHDISTVGKIYVDDFYKLIK
jgi:glycosyltransferase involved in cell wall biosynthesis